MAVKTAPECSRFSLLYFYFFFKDLKLGNFPPLGKQRYMTISFESKKFEKNQYYIPLVWRFLVPMSILKNLMHYTARCVPTLNKSNIAV